LMRHHFNGEHRIGVLLSDVAATFGFHNPVFAFLSAAMSP
jgi:hypothetical protein